MVSHSVIGQPMVSHGVIGEPMVSYGVIEKPMVSLGVQKLRALERLTSELEISLFPKKATIGGRNGVQP